MKFYIKLVTLCMLKGRFSPCLTLDICHSLPLYWVLPHIAGYKPEKLKVMLAYEVQLVVEGSGFYHH